MPNQPRNPEPRTGRPLGSAEPSSPRLGGDAPVSIDLGDGEEVVLAIGPHWIYVLIDRLPVLVALVAAAAIGAAVAGGWLRIALVASPAIWIVWQFIERASRRYVLTSGRVVVVAGVLRQIVVDAPLANVRQVSVFRSVPERLLGLGTVTFATAGTGGQDLVWRIVDRPRERLVIAREALDRAADRLSDRAPGGVSGGVSGGGAV